MRWYSVVVVSLLAVALAAPVIADEDVSDGALRDAIMIKLAGDRDVRGTQIEVTVKDGVVTLRGPVFDKKAKKRAEKLAKKEKGVKKVVNELKVTAIKTGGG